MEFIVLKNIGGFLKGSTITIVLKNGGTLEYLLISKLPEYFAELKTGKFDDDWEYTGEFRPPRANEYYVCKAYGGGITVTRACRNCIENKYILRKIENSPTKQEILKALDASIEHWLDILKKVLARETKHLPLGPKNCPLCQLFYYEGRLVPLWCELCPLQSCSPRKDNAYSTFFNASTAENALAMIMELQRCKDKLLDEINEEKCK